MDERLSVRVIWCFLFSFEVFLGLIPHILSGLVSQVCFIASPPNVSQPSPSCT